MTHELLAILEAYREFRSRNLSCVMVTLVHLEGSSYRKPGVRMLIAEDHSIGVEGSTSNVFCTPFTYREYCAISNEFDLEVKLLCAFMHFKFKNLTDSFRTLIV